jgi:hypothetical protein
MNINEFFYFKTIECSRKDIHDYDYCYNYHTFNRDIRRIILNTKINSDKTLVPVSMLKLYSNKVGFENDQLNQIIFGNLQLCRNPIEVKYHILNYKIEPCYFELNRIKCIYSKICPYLHVGELISKEIHEFKIFYEKICTTHEVLLSEIELFLEKINNSKYYLKFEQNLVLPIENESILKEKSTNLKKPKAQVLPKKSETSILIKVKDKLSEFIKNSIYSELKNITVLCRGDLFTKIINTENRIIFCTNNYPKKDELNKLMIAFLNSHDGIMLYGADINTKKLTGIKMDRKSRDLFKQTFNTEYKDILVEYEGFIKYKFYDLENGINSTTNTENYCIIVMKIKKLRESKLVFDPYNKSFIIKEKFLKRFRENCSEHIKITDIKQLNMKEYIEITRSRLIDYFSNILK